MKTSELVELLAHDGTRSAAPGSTLLRALLPAGMLSAALLVLLIGIRADVGDALQTPRFNLKLLLNAALWISATGLLLRLARPVDRPGLWTRALWLVPVALLLAVLVELFLLPRDQWWPVAHGRNSTWCLRIIPALSIAPLAASLWALRRAAPARPALAGAAAGLMCAGLAGTLYAMHCPDDSPLFVAIWYVLAAALVTL
ncbi:MAG TPA: NrsF family protein, partial [Steroidobacteraceae bacterium]|nr:NrsF family protein [Steroidobacteraceae bacterium]